MDDSIMTGIIGFPANNIVFYSDKYDYTFFPKEIMDYREKVKFYTEGGFVYGLAHSGHRVAIFLGKGYEKYGFSREVHISTPMFVKTEIADQDVPIRTFRTIIFFGGILNSLSKEEISFPEYDELDNISIKRTTKVEKYSFHTRQGKCNFSIGSCMADSWSDKKAKIENQIFLSLEFDIDQPLSSVFRHYQHVKRLISIMTNRVDNHFDGIILAPNDKEPNRHLKNLNVYIRDNEVPLEKKYSKITFEDLGNSAARLLELFYLSKEKKPSYSLGFIPQNDSDYRVISEDKVRAICSALECEIMFHKEIDNSQSEALKELCKRVKETVKQYRKEEEASPTLSDGTYDVINGSISHWSMSAYEKVTWLYHEYKEAITKYNYGIPMIQEEEIHEFIKYRNNITHGSFQLMTPSICKTAIAMEVLVICSLLHRSGVSKEKIIELCEMDICR